MLLQGAARVSYRVNANLIPSGQSLRIEYFDSSTSTWKNLQTLNGNGTSGYVSDTNTVPASGAGDYFAVRFSAWGTAYTSSYSWVVDDVSIMAIATAPRLSIALTITNTVAISWPSSATGFTLQTNSSLNPASWGGLGTVPSDDGTNKLIIVNPLADTLLFRLAN
jgi:hypothetical protein